MPNAPKIVDYKNHLYRSQYKNVQIWSAICIFYCTHTTPSHFWTFVPHLNMHNTDHLNFATKQNATAPISMRLGFPDALPNPKFIAPRNGFYLGTCHSGPIGAEGEQCLNNWIIWSFAVANINLSWRRWRIATWELQTCDGDTCFINASKNHIRCLKDICVSYRTSQLNSVY